MDLSLEKSEWPSFQLSQTPQGYSRTGVPHALYCMLPTMAKGGTGPRWAVVWLMDTVWAVKVVHQVAAAVCAGRSL